MKKTVLLFLVLLPVLLFFNSFTIEPVKLNSVEYIYQFSLEGVHNRADAKIANDAAIRPFFNKVADFDESSETFEVVTTLDVDVEKFRLSCKKRNYELLGFKQFIID